MKLTPGQYASISPDYRREVDGLPFVVDVDLASLATKLVPVELTDNPPPPEVPPHYAGTWPLDPRD